jgi:hypothetical protein
VALNGTMFIPNYVKSNSNIEKKERKKIHQCDLIGPLYSFKKKEYCKKVSLQITTN